MTIKKIIRINDMAVFKDFDWDKSLRDKANNKIEFKRVNIIYGRNYSGKTTLSRIVRGLETHKISDKYPQAKFEIEIEGDGIISLDNLGAHTQTIRVYNEDFVKDNLQFLVNDSEGIQSFAILGDKNIEIEAEIQAKEVELGIEDPSVGLLGEERNKQVDYNKAKDALVIRQEELEDLLKKKANNEIKTNSVYQDVNYTIIKIKKDIQQIVGDSFSDIASDEILPLQDLLREVPKQHIKDMQVKSLCLDKLMEEVKLLVEKKITISNPIKELIEDSLLESWVRNGIEHHKGKRTTCSFCRQELPASLIDDLDKHFNKESEALRGEIETFIVKLEEKIRDDGILLSFNEDQFYTAEKAMIDELEKRYKTFIADYTDMLNMLSAQLKIRLKSISNPIFFERCTDTSERLADIVKEYNLIVHQVNEKTKSLNKKQSEARDRLRLHEISTFLNTINYSDKQAKILAVEKTKKIAAAALKEVKEKVTKCKFEINELKTQLKDEKKGAEQVNKYLNNYFGHDALRLEPVEAENENGKFKFEIQREGERAYHLSEGECSLISFCYFMAKLEDVNTKGNEMIIWIDDPISSLDANHVFFIYALINGEIVKEDKYKQLFISTHNLDFLKYLKRLAPQRKSDYGKKVLNFLVQRQGDASSIIEMPKYMTEYVTEFNYLFHKIYQCANGDGKSGNDLTVYYDFGNNARKFLELLLAFKFPNPEMKDDDKLNAFLGESCVEGMLVDRINNEYSHLCGAFERGMRPIDIPDMKKTAEFIIRRVYENDKDQFNSFLESIGEMPWA